MSLTKKDIEHVAHLAKLTLTDQEVEKYVHELSPVVDYFNDLSQVDTESVTATSQTTGLVDITRPDEITAQSLTQDEAISSAQKTHNGYIVVPRILSKEVDD